jgi:hypothetical protein
MDKIRDKRAFRQSLSTVLRERDPTSPEIANRGNVNMVMDFSRQQEVVPSRLGATMNTSRTMNASGRPMALDVMVGGFPDARASNKGPKMQARQQLTPTKGR